MDFTEVILVSENDEEIGKEEKLKAHESGLLHRAFSIFIFNSNGEMLLQQRAMNKYHSGGLWTNACCSHPTPGEITEQAAIRRLQEEMGFVTSLSKQFDFTYKAHFQNGLTEFEFDHVYTGIYDGIVNYNNDEVMSIVHKPLDMLSHSLNANPEQYTVWFQIAFPKIVPWWISHFNLKLD